MHTLTTLPALNTPWPLPDQEGALFAGVTTAPDGEIYALVLLPAQGTDLNRPDATAWAASIGGALPTRPEAALLFANCRRAFEPRWHWTCEQVTARHAWLQHFGNGFQNGHAGHRFEGRARAVRRFQLSA